MGIRLKEEIRQCLLINALPKELKKERLEQTSSEITRMKGTEAGTVAKTERSGTSKALVLLLEFLVGANNKRIRKTWRN